MLKEILSSQHGWHTGNRLHPWKLLNDVVHVCRLNVHQGCPTFRLWRAA